MRILVLFFILFPTVSTPQDAEDNKVKFIRVPTSKNVLVGKVGEFNCTAEGVTNMYWEVNGVPMNGNRPGFNFTKTMVLNDTTDVRTTLLRATGSSYTNGSNITCIIVNRLLVSSNESQPPALFLVQGLLESVNNLNVTLINSITVLISWSPPFTLEGVPILGYNVIITNNTSVLSVTVNNTWLYYSCREPTCSMNITVIAVNGAGDGYPAMISKLIHPSHSDTISSTTYNQRPVSSYISAISGIPVPTITNSSTPMVPSSLATTISPTKGTSVVGMVTGIVVAVAAVVVVLPLLCGISVILIFKWRRRKGYMDIDHGHEMRVIESEDNKDTEQANISTGSQPQPQGCPEATRNWGVRFSVSEKCDGEVDIDEREKLTTSLLKEMKAGERQHNRKDRRVSCSEMENKDYKENIQQRCGRLPLLRSISMPEASSLSYLKMSRKESSVEPQVQNGYEMPAEAEVGAKPSLPSFGDSFRSNTLPRTPKRTNSRTTDGLANSADALVPKSTPPPNFNTDEQNEPNETGDD